MGWKGVVELVVMGLTAAGELVKGILQRTGHLNEADPWLTLGMVGVQYLGRALTAEDNDTLKELLTRSPIDLWAEAGDIETENALIRQRQLERIGDRD